MSIPLLKIELKSNSKIILLFLAIITLYAGIITAMYNPELGAGINELAKSMPQFCSFWNGKPRDNTIRFLKQLFVWFYLNIDTFYIHNLNVLQISC